MNVAFKDWPPGLSTNSSVYMCRQPIQKRIRLYYYNFSNNQTNFIRVKLISVMVRVRSGTGLRKVREFFRGLSNIQMCWVVHKENIVLIHVPESYRES